MSTTIPQQLRLLQKLSGLSQAALAQKLGVTFAAFNRWINGKAVPRKQAQERILALYRELSGLSAIDPDALKAKKTILLTKSRKKKNVLRAILDSPDIRDQFVLTLTYTSNSIEGSTLTEAETAVVLFQNTTLVNKTLTEQLEAKNHQAALLALFNHLLQRKPMDEALILRLHGMLMNGIRQDAGSYRTHGVRIVGADVPTANHLSVPRLMESLIQDFSRRRSDIIAHVAETHARFEQIHPFSDGNGRVGRLLMHAMFLRQNVPPVVIHPDHKRIYYATLNRAQKSGDTTGLQDFLSDGLFEGWEIVERR